MLIFQFPILHVSVIESVNLGKIHQELEQSNYIDGFIGVSLNGTELTVYGDSFNDENGVDAIVDNHLSLTIESYKNSLYELVISTLPKELETFVPVGTKTESIT